MATMVDDEVLRHALSDSETMILLDQGQREINSGRDARGSPYVAVPTVDAIRLDPDGWIVFLKASCKSPVRRRSTPVQQPSRRERRSASRGQNPRRWFRARPDHGSIWTVGHLKSEPHSFRNLG